MRIRALASDARHDILELEPLLRRVVGARGRDPDTVDDLVQEALARVIAARERLDDEAVTPYAIVTARNLVTSLAREQERGRRRPRPPCRPRRRPQGRWVGGAAGRARTVPAPRPRPGGPGQARRSAGQGACPSRPGAPTPTRGSGSGPAPATSSGCSWSAGASRHSRVRSGQRASFAGRLAPNPPGSAQRVGMVPSEGAALAKRQGHHIEVAYADITLEP
jgi:hypothetical protein